MVESNRPEQCHSPESFSHIAYKTQEILQLRTNIAVHVNGSSANIDSMLQHHWHDESYTSIYPSISRYIYYLFLTMLTMSSSWRKQLLPSTVPVFVVLTQGRPLAFVSLHITVWSHEPKYSPESLSLDQPSCLTPRLGQVRYTQVKPEPERTNKIYTNP